MDTDGGQRFNGRTEWGFVFLTLESGGMNILNILKRASIKDFAFKAATAAQAAGALYTRSEYTVFLFFILFVTSTCAHTHFITHPPTQAPPSLRPCPLLCLIRLSGC